MRIKLLAHIVNTVNNSTLHVWCAVLSTEQKSGLTHTRQMKEAAFLHKVREIASEERANQLRW